MKDWFNTLQTRERYLLIGGSIVLAMLALYLWVLEPVSKELAQLRTSVTAGERQLVWMQKASAEAKSLKGGNRSTSVDTRTSLITVVERTATSSGIRAQLKRMEPQGSSKISTEFQGVSFNRLMSWLGSIEKRYGVKPVQLNSTRHALSGRVDARIILSRGES